MQLVVRGLNFVSFNKENAMHLCCLFIITGSLPTDTRRNNNVIMTSKGRRDIISI